MNILHIVRQFHPAVGGLENYVLNLSLYQIQAGHKVSVVTLDRNYLNNEKLDASEKLENGIDIIRIPFSFSKKYPLAPGCYMHLKGYDIITVHAVDFFADFIALTKFFHKKKTVLVTHGGFFHSNWGSLLKKMYFNTITRFSLKSYDAIIGCSTNDVKIFKQITSKIQLIHNGVNIQPYLAKPKKRVNGQLLYVGRLDNHKRIDLLIQLTAHLNHSGTNAHLNIVGPDWANLSEKLKDLAKKLGIKDFVSLKGAVTNEELAELYSTADIFVSASEYEGFGLTVVEAMASGTPCILSKIESFEFLLENKPFGAICNFSNSEETANQIKRFLNYTSDEYLVISAKAREYSKRFNWENVSGKFDKIYTDLLVK